MNSPYPGGEGCQGRLKASLQPLRAVLPVSPACWRLAHQFDELVRSGAVKDCAELERLGHVTRARVTQITNLLNLAPELQEYLLWLPPRRGNGITEREMRQIVGEVRWDRPGVLFRQHERRGSV